MELDRMNDDHTSTEGTRHYEQPEADQAERRKILKQDAQALTYFDLANGDGDDDKQRAHVVGANALGPMLPAPAWATDPTGKERPLGQDVNALPDMRACWWIEGAVAPGEPTDEA
jgi:hypothetical protein